jgi:two-component system sensor histidine kinase KdpD
MRDQAATALAKVQLAVAMDRARLLTETDRLRTALLSSLSHDLRTPLVSIKGTTTALLQLGDALAASEKRELLENVVEETERLNRYVQNLLDMTRLGYGVVAARPEWRDVREIAGAARRALQSVLNERSVRITIANGDDLIHTDAALLEQVLVNLLENAAKYSPPNEPIEIDGRRVEGNYELTVCDYGPGVPPADRERVFDLFAIARSPNGQVAGSGVGLAICKGFAEALGGSIAVSGRHAAAGACFRLRLPQPKEIPFRGAAE